MSDSWEGRVAHLRLLYSRLGVDDCEELIAEEMEAGGPALARTHFVAGLWSALIESLDRIVPETNTDPKWLSFRDDYLPLVKRLVLETAIDVLGRIDQGWEYEDIPGWSLVEHRFDGAGGRPILNVARAFVLTDPSGDAGQSILNWRGPGELN